MDREKMLAQRQWIRDQLANVADFWLKNGMDPVNGGIYTCLDRKGKVFSTDKSVWMQGRCGWTYAYLCHVYGVRPEWLEASKSCIDFLEKYCVNHEAGGRLYFTSPATASPCVSAATASAKPSTAWPMPSITASPGRKSTWSGHAGPTTCTGI